MPRICEDNYLRWVFKFLKRLNEQENYNVYTENDMSEEIDNLKDLNITIEKLYGFLDTIKEKKDVDDLSDYILELHFILSDIEWQYEQINDMIKNYMEYIRKR